MTSARPQCPWTWCSLGLEGSKYWWDSPSLKEFRVRSLRGNEMIIIGYDSWVWKSVQDVQGRGRETLAPTWWRELAAKKGFPGKITPDLDLREKVRIHQTKWGTQTAEGGYLPEMSFSCYLYFLPWLPFHSLSQELSIYKNSYYMSSYIHI